ncbi:hypothetical protein [uncultured Veillonella sp.]|uniref:hypothetical protein n=1 Tax=uncultured Veillonella sp. TaxID=159268 RepID=UPI0025980595|nr:hypothetical protein [uncultured Veillonella sp.]
MSKTVRYDEAYTRRKNRRKYWRTLAQIVLLVGAVAVGGWQYMHPPVYEPYAAAGTADPLLVLDYEGVQNTGGRRALVDDDALQRQLSALKDDGYQTIDAATAADYFKTGRDLPSRPLYVLFNDGRRDTAVFAAPVLEALNYHGTIVTQPWQLDMKDKKFLQSDDIALVEESTFWDVAVRTAAEAHAVQAQGVTVPIAVVPLREAAKTNNQQASGNVGTVHYVKVAPWWPVNHLLMRIQEVTKQNISFAAGRKAVQEQFVTIDGALACFDENIVLTTEPGKAAKAVLRDGNSEDVAVDVTLNGRVDGAQALYLRYNGDTQYVAIAIRDNHLYVREAVDGTVRDLADISLIGNPPDGLGLSEARGEWKLAITLTGHVLSLKVNGEKVPLIKVHQLQKGTLALAAAPLLIKNTDGDEDGIYDGVFNSLVMTDLHTNTVVVSGRFDGGKRLMHTVKGWTDTVMDWFIHYL